MTTETPRPISTLSFTSTEGDIVNLWPRDLIDGGIAADECLDYISEYQAMPLLGQVAKAQILLGRYGPTEIAFWQRVAERAIFI